LATRMSLALTKLEILGDTSRGLWHNLCSLIAGYGCFVRGSLLSKNIIKVRQASWMIWGTADLAGQVLDDLGHSGSGWARKTSTHVSAQPSHMIWGLAAPSIDASQNVSKTKQWRPFTGRFHKNDETKHDEFSISPPEHCNHIQVLVLPTEQLGDRFIRFHSLFRCTQAVSKIMINIGKTGSWMSRHV
jgi:hypothetical protein